MGGLRSFIRVNQGMSQYRPSCFWHISPLKANSLNTVGSYPFASRKLDAYA